MKGRLRNVNRMVPLSWPCTSPERHPRMMLEEWPMRSEKLTSLLQEVASLCVSGEVFSGIWSADKVALKIEIKKLSAIRCTGGAFYTRFWIWELVDGKHLLSFISIYSINFALLKHPAVMIFSYFLVTTFKKCLTNVKIIMTKKRIDIERCWDKQVTVTCRYVFSHIRWTQLV